MSIKTKILLITIALLVFATGTIYMVNRNVFLKDKESYLYSATLQNLDQESRGLLSEYMDLYNRLRTVLTFFNPEIQKFEERIRQLTISQDWGRFAIYKDSPAGQLELADSVSASTFNPDLNLIKQIRNQQPGVPNLQADPQDPTKMFLMMKQGSYFVYAEFTLKSLTRILTDRRFTVVNLKQNRILNPALTSSLPNLQVNLLELALKNRNAGVKEISADGEDYLVSFKEIPPLSLSLLEAHNTKDVFAVVQKTVRQTLLISLLVLSVGIIAMFFGINQITGNLLKVAQEMEIFSQKGQAAKLVLKSKDEVGKIATVFNSMLDKITLLLRQTAETSRMEAELETAKEVQMTLLPKDKLEGEKFFIKGFYRPASECGGDLWFYHQDGSRLLIFVADATGHGVSAALITAAARATLAVATTEKIWNPAKILDLVNKTLCETSKGEKMMTAFVAVIDTLTDTVTYANASHEPPFILPLKQTEKITKNHLEFLIGTTGKRLGQDWDQVYTNTTHQMKKGQCLVLYTDGLTDAINIKEEAFGERRMLKAAVESANTESNRNFHDKLSMTISEFTEKTPQPDDITFVSVMLK